MVKKWYYIKYNMQFIGYKCQTYLFFINLRLLKVERL